jgi:uncharacterized protein (TIGR03083 family)
MTLPQHARALAEFDRRVEAIRPDQWRNPTPCTEWDVRALVNHLVIEQLWVPLLLDGATTADVGDRFDGDQLGDDPVAAWKSAAAAAREACAAPGALHRLTVHAWDLAQGIGTDALLDEELVQEVLRFVEPQVDQLVGTGLFAAPAEVGDDADVQTRLLALLGRRA